MNRRAAWLLLAGLFASRLAAVPEPVPLAGFRRVLVLEQGRVKPLDTFARNLLKLFSGRDSAPGMDAASWLARLLFSPQAAAGDSVFIVRRPELLEAMGIAGAGANRYSYAQLRPGLRALHGLARGTAPSEGAPSPLADEATRLLYNLSVFHALGESFSFAREDGLLARASSLPALVPLAAERWLSPGQILEGEGTPSPAVKQELALLRTAARAYVGRDGPAFANALDAFNRSVRLRLGGEAVPPWRIAMEVLYHRCAPFAGAGAAYALALLLLLAGMAANRPPLRRLGRWALLLGVLAHTLGLAARMLVSGRPPVTSLYETLLFVAWTAALLGLVLGRRPGPAPAAGALGSLLLLLLSGRYALEGDTFVMLAAVLDSNLWLTVHVATIALGYAGCVLAGILGHVLLIQAGRGRSDAAAATVRPLHAVLAFGLVFTAIGTLMGAVWADQSWGRFWGWDPKENGALLIIAWLAAVFHARRARWIGGTGLAAGAVGSLVTVALAWFGVHLLGLGLHAYGFTSGAAWALLAFVALELAFLAVVLPLARRHRS